MDVNEIDNYPLVKYGNFVYDQIIETEKKLNEAYEALNKLEMSIGIYVAGVTHDEIVLRRSIKDGI